MEIVKVTKGKGVLLSCEGDAPIYHRSPVDVVGVGVLLGLTHEQALQCLGPNCDLLLKKAHQRKTVSGVCEVVKWEEEDVKMSE